MILYFMLLPLAIIALPEVDLLIAAEKGNIADAAAAIKAGADVNASTPISEKTALMMAAENGHSAIVKLLIGAKADVNAREKDGTTALKYATANGHKEIIRMLIDAGAK